MPAVLKTNVGVRKSQVIPQLGTVDLVGVGYTLGSSAARIVNQEPGHGNQKAGQTHDEKSPRPPPFLAHESADRVADRSSQRQRQVVDAHRPAPPLGREQVRDESGGDHAVTCLADSKECPPEEHVVEVRGKRCPHGRQAPHGHSASQQHTAVVAISQPSHQRRYERVHDHERRTQHAVPEVVDVQVVLDLCSDREERVTVDVVQQIHAEQDRHREIGATDGGNDAGFGGRGDRGVRTGRQHREAASPGISRTDQTNRYTRFTLDWRDPWISNNRAAAFVS